jgi:sialate O-acetylesterase
LISVPQVASQEPLNDFAGQWEACTPETVKSFSAVGYFFGRQLHQTLDVPVGLIDNAWGGSAAEAWVRRDVLESDGKYGELLEKWDTLAKTYDHEAALAKWEEKDAAWQETKEGLRPRRPGNPLTGNHRPANLYSGVLHPVLGYTIQGVIWYQGESNAGRAYQYRDLFPLMIQNWRDDWGQGDFSFYWVQLADFLGEVDEPAESAWAELREAQTMTLSKLPNTGQAVITDLGEATDIHPKNKQDVAKRLARWALANDYGIDIVHQSPTYQSMETKGNKAILKFDHVGLVRLDTFDVREPIGFAIAAEDKVFVNATAKIAGKDTVEVWSDAVENPVAVRYAWADNPICNVQNAEGLPMTPFRTDDWPGVTISIVK